MDTIKLRSRYDRRKSAPLLEFRPITLDEVKSLRPGDRVTCISNQNDAIEVRVTGMVKTWKRDATRVQVPVKYGLYESGYITERNISRFLVAVD